jgi:hypothetical protein
MIKRALRAVALPVFNALDRHVFPRLAERTADIEAVSETAVLLERSIMALRDDLESLSPPDGTLLVTGAPELADPAVEALTSSGWVVLESVSGDSSRLLLGRPDRD